MKTYILYFILGLVVVFLILQFMSFRSTQKIENYNYVILQTLGDVEIREYGKANFIKTNLRNDSYEKISGEGFRILAGYIFGDNKSNEKIAMTSPVVMDMKNSRNMYFMIPKSINPLEMPLANTEKIEIVKKKKHTVASIGFSGWADEKKIQDYIERLTLKLDNNNIKHANNFQFLGYNPPYELFNRKNEVIVEVII